MTKKAIIFVDRSFVFIRNFVFIINGINRTLRFTCATINTFFWVYIQLLIGSIIATCFCFFSRSFRIVWSTSW